MDISEIGVLTLESTCSLFIAVIAYKLYRMKIDTESDGSCCKLLNFKFATHNSGHSEASSPMTAV